MNIDTMTWNDLPEFNGQTVLIYGLDDNAFNLVRHIRAKFPEIAISGLLLIS